MNTTLQTNKQLPPLPQTQAGAEDQSTVLGGPPAPMGVCAFHGVAGRAVKALAPFTEADPNGILLALLCLFGNRIGKGVNYLVPGGGSHQTNEYLAIVGATALARKSTVWDVVTNLWRHAEPDLADGDALCAGISSGESLIERLQDRPADTKHLVAGTRDKRLLVYLDEFGTMFETMIREGNTLGELIKVGFSGAPMQLMIKGNRQRASGYHLSLIAASTSEQLRSVLSSSSHRKLRTKASDGFTNRFLWAYVKRSQKKPRITGDEQKQLAVAQKKFGAELGKILASAADGQCEMQWHKDAEAAWDSWYNEFAIPDGMGGYLGRGEAHVIRLAMIYALLDGAKAIRLSHLSAATEVWRYCRDSAMHIFSTIKGSSSDSSVRTGQLAARIMERLGPYPGMTKAEIIRKVFSNNV